MADEFNSYYPKRIPADDLLDERAFWNLHVDLMYGMEEEDDVTSIFGTSRSYLEKFYRTRLVGAVAGEPLAYPCYNISIDLGDGRRFDVDYCEFELDGSSINYSIFLSTWSKPIMVASQEGHWTLPGLRWEELKQIARAANTPSPAQTLLLLFPCVWIDGKTEGHDVVTSLGNAWLDSGLLTKDNAILLAQQMMRAASNRCNWTYRADIGWLCDEGNCIRNAQRTDVETLLRIRDFLCGFQEQKS